MPKQTKLPPFETGVEAEEIAAQWIANPERSGRLLMSEGAVRWIVDLALDPTLLRDTTFHTSDGSGEARWRAHKEAQAARIAEINALPMPERMRQGIGHNRNEGYSQHYGMTLARLFADYPDEAPMLWTWARDVSKKRMNTGEGRARVAARILHFAAEGNGAPPPKPEAIADRVLRRSKMRITTAVAESAVKAERKRGRKGQGK